MEATPEPKTGILDDLDALAYPRGSREGTPTGYLAGRGGRCDQLVEDEDRLRDLVALEESSTDIREVRFENRATPGFVLSWRRALVAKAVRRALDRGARNVRRLSAEGV